MKVLVLSDAHSNIDALHAVEREAGSVDRVLFLGDMVDFGFFPHEVIGWMKEHDVRAVAGNHDTYLAKMAEEGIVPPKRAMDADSFALHNLALLTKEDLAYLRALPDERVEEIDGITYYMTHTCTGEDLQGFLRKMMDFHSVEAFEALWAEKVWPAKLGQQRRIIFGHTHQCMAHIIRGGAMWMNPGSLSYRLGPDGRGHGADYILIKDGDVLLRHVDYPTEHLYRMVEESALEGTNRINGRNFYEQEVL